VFFLQIQPQVKIFALVPQAIMGTSDSHVTMRLRELIKNIFCKNPIQPKPNLKDKTTLVLENIQEIFCGWKICGISWKFPRLSDLKIDSDNYW